MPTRSSFLGWYLRRRNGCFFGVTPEAAQEYVTIEDITAETDVSLRTFGNYFSSKYEAICTIGTDRARRIGATLLAHPAGEPLWEAISNAVLAHYEGTGQALVEAIAARTGTDLEQDMYPADPGGRRHRRGAGRGQAVVRRRPARAARAAAAASARAARDGLLGGAGRRVNEEEFKVPAGTTRLRPNGCGCAPPVG